MTSRRWPYRSTAGWATSRRPASRSGCATSASPPSTKAPTASRPWTWSVASCRCARAASAATPYLRMFGIVAGGWVMARQAVAAERLGSDDPFNAAKLMTARFYLEELLPHAQGLRNAITAGDGILFALTPEQLDSRR